jgi:hypothetical protein
MNITNKNKNPHKRSHGLLRIINVIDKLEPSINPTKLACQDQHIYILIILKIVIINKMPNVLPSYYTNESQLKPAMLEITPAKQCEGYPYLGGIGPMAGQCSKFLATQHGQYNYTRYNCPGGAYNGRPFNNIVSEPFSNEYWQNTWCETQGQTPLKPL